MLPDDFDDDEFEPEGEPIRECPFCGSPCTTDDVCEVQDEDGGIGHFYVMCNVCSAAGPICDTEDEAVFEWGDRVCDDEDLPNF